MVDYTISIRITGDESDAKRAFSQVQDAMRDTEHAATSSTSGMGRQFTQLGQQIQGAIAGAIVNFGLEGIGQMRELGDGIRQVEGRFEQLAGSPLAAEEAIDSLIEKTGGIVSEAQLMRDAVGAVMTDVASDFDQAGDLIQLGLQLAGESGKDALLQAMKTQQTDLLDNIGISASAVIALREQYKAAGMNSAEAFNRAVLEVGRQTADALGDTVHIAESSFARLQTRVENIMNDISQNVIATGVEAGAQIVEIVALSIEQAEAVRAAALAADKEAQELGNQIVEAAQAAVPEAESAYADLGSAAAVAFDDAFTAQVLDAARQNPALSAQEIAAQVSPVAMLDPEMADQTIQAVEAILGARNHVLADAERELVVQRQLNERLEEQARMAEYTAGWRQMAADEAEREARAELAREGRRGSSMAGRYETDLETAQRQQFEAEQELNRERERGFSILSQQTYQMSAQYAEAQMLQDTAGLLYGTVVSSGTGANAIDIAQRGRRGDTEFFSQAEVDRLHTLQTEAHNALEQLQDLQEQGIATDAQLNQAQQYADYIDGITDAAERGKQARDDLVSSLSNLFGQQGGGAFNEIDTQILAGLQDSGMGEDQIAALQDALALDSGAETALSQQFETEVLPLLTEIARTQGADAVTEARRAYVEGVQNAIASGEDVPSIWEMTGYYTGADGSAMSMQLSPEAQAAYGGIVAGSGTFSADASGMEGSTSGAAELQTQMADINASSVMFKDNMILVGEQLTYQADTTPIIAEKMGLFADNSQKAHSWIEGVHTFIGELTSTPQKIAFEVEAGYSGSTPAWFVDLFNRQLAYVQAANGGALPGGDPRAE